MAYNHRCFFRYRFALKWWPRLKGCSLVSKWLRNTFLTVCTHCCYNYDTQFQLKDLKRQVQTERKRADKLQEKLQELLTDSMKDRHCEYELLGSVGNSCLPSVNHQSTRQVEGSGFDQTSIVGRAVKPFSLSCFYRICFTETRDSFILL